MWSVFTTIRMVLKSRSWAGSRNAEHTSAIARRVLTERRLVIRSVISGGNRASIRLWVRVQVRVLCLEGMRTRSVRQGGTCNMTDAYIVLGPVVYLT